METAISDDKHKKALRHHIDAEGFVLNFRTAQCGDKGPKLR
ncbi:hypothetical protein [Geoalkalibacter sp.]|nr:hypothetical protein [Geoalkalibacter sp.]